MTIFLNIVGHCYYRFATNCFNLNICTDFNVYFDILTPSFNNFGQNTKICKTNVKNLCRYLIFI